MESIGMLKKNIKIIERTLNREKENLSKIIADNGYFYAMDGYRMVRCEDIPDGLPVFEKNESHPNAEVFMTRAAEQTYREFVVPYPIEALKKWRTWLRKNKKREPYILGISGETSNHRKHWFGIDITFLIDAIETTGSYVIKVPERYTAMVMEGNGFGWIIMPVDVKDGATRGETVINVV